MKNIKQNICLEPISSSPCVNEDKAKIIVFEKVRRIYLNNDNKDKYVIQLSGPNSQVKNEVIDKIINRNRKCLILAGKDLTEKLLSIPSKDKDDNPPKELEEIVNNQYATSRLLILKDVGLGDYIFRKSEAGFLVSILHQRFLNHLPTVISTTLGRNGLQSFLLENLLSYFKDNWDTFYIMQNKEIRKFLRYDVKEEEQ